MNSGPGANLLDTQPHCVGTGEILGAPGKSTVEVDSAPLPVNLEDMVSGPVQDTEVLGSWNMGFPAVGE